MRKLHAIGLAIGTVLALCAFMAPSAFAQSKLLANGAEITADLAVTLTGELLLKNNHGVEVLCSGIFDSLIEGSATVGLGGVLGFVNEVLTLGGTLIASTKNDLVGAKEGDAIECVKVKVCENEPVLITALNLPWHVEVELEGTAYFLDFLALNEAGAEVGYNIECRVLGINANAFCDGLVRAELLLNALGDAAAWFEDATTGTQACSDGSIVSVLSEGEESAFVDADGALMTFSE